MEEEDGEEPGGTLARGQTAILHAGDEGPDPEGAGGDEEDDGCDEDGEIQLGHEEWHMDTTTHAMGIGDEGVTGGGFFDPEKG